MTSQADIEGNNLAHWRDMAEDLAYAAEILKQHQSHSNETCRDKVTLGELFLWGAALEDFLKALYLKRGGFLYEAGEFKGRTGHDLVKMAGDVKFSLTSSQGRVLEILTKILKWAGRYPVPRQGSQLISLYWMDEGDHAVLESMIESLRTALDK
jgi:hypothetical protein